MGYALEAAEKMLGRTRIRNKDVAFFPADKLFALRSREFTATSVVVYVYAR